MASVNCFEFVVSLLKLLEKVSRPRGQRSLNGVLVDGGAARLPVEYRSIVRGAESIRGRRVRAWGQSPQVHKNKLSQTPDVPESVVNRLPWGARSDAGTWNHAAKLKQLNGNCGRQSSNALRG